MPKRPTVIGKGGQSPLLTGPAFCREVSRGAGPVPQGAARQGLRRDQARPHPLRRAMAEAEEQATMHAVPIFSRLCH